MTQFCEFTNYQRNKWIFLNIFSGSIATSCELQINELLVYHIAR